MFAVYHAVQLLLFVPSKVCACCHVEKPIEDFYGHKRYGRLARCKTCVIAKNKAYHDAHYVHRRKPLPLTEHGMICRTCHVEKPLSEFHKRTNGKHHTECKACMVIRRRENARKSGAKPRRPENLPPVVNGGIVCIRCLTEKSLDHFIADRRAKTGYLQTCKDCRYAIEKETYAAGEKREQKRAWVRKSYEAHREHHRKLMREWAKAHPEKVREMSRRYMARKKDAAVDYVDYSSILERDQGICHICGGIVTSYLEFDHVIPLSRGGTHSTDNIKVAHRACNRRKSNKLMEELTPYDRRGMSARIN